MKVKAFRVSGVMRIKDSWQKFSVELTEVSEERAIERVYSLLGSRHKLKRAHIKVLEVRELNPDEVTDLRVRRLLSADKVVVFTR
ncbi:MAG: 50S ribosomal protein LX [Thermoprotei archaeon]|nr:MAG: 50S ribosomal protein LX [Thermoprotei archaeon]